ncbi:hypothetical protein PIB30_015115 [Stylosanthes scabra]|uniref:Uncharacterized protein n=1 Tax=Stylosanthes scabra TaxID=79078 RepID=A0ABU6R794_9FABA|nr:hypothetical protein [Stylosanthes scabra]
MTPHPGDGGDAYVWKPNPKGQFSLKSAYSMLAALHVIRGCPKAARVWNLLVNPRLIGRFYSMNLLDWVLSNLRDKWGLQQDNQWKDILGANLEWIYAL